MVNFNGNVTAENIQVNENTQGDVTMSVGASSSDIKWLVSEIRGLMEREKIEDVELSEIIEDADREDPKKTSEKLWAYAKRAREIIGTVGGVSSSVVSVIALIDKVLGG